MNIWKRNAIVAVVVLFVCVAVYMNWSMNQVTPVDSDYEEFEASHMDQEQAGQTSTTETASPTQSDGTAAPAASPEAGTQTEAVQDNSYFSEARLSRQQARDSALSVLNNAADQETASSESFAQEVSAIAQSALQEVRIENLVKAKGYSDCVAFINDEGISVVVAAPASGLNQTDVAKIRDIAQGETGFPSEQIKIVEVK